LIELQIALQIGTKPTHWQWIALFEIAAAMVLVGMLAAASLMWQYWGILSGREHYDDGTRQPLLDSEMQVGVSDRFKWSPGGGGGGGQEDEKHKSWQ
jgi:hypothetical protein